MQRVVIVGAGISGLSLAYRLQSLCDAEIHVLEASSRFGGVLWTDVSDGFVVEYGANGFLDNQPSTIELARELDLGDRLIAASPAAGRNRYLVLGNRLVPLPTSIRTFVRSPLLTWRGKLRLLAEPLLHRRPARPESVSEFARRRFGDEAADVLIDAITTGIHGGDPSLLDVRAAFPRLSKMEVEFGGIVRAMLSSRGGPRQMWSFTGGMRDLIDALAKNLRIAPRLGMTVRRLATAVGRWRVELAGGHHVDADAVVLTCPAPMQASIVSELDEPMAGLMAGIAYNRIAVVALGYRASDLTAPWPGFGFIVPQRTRRDLLGVQWCSETYLGRAPNGMVLWRALCGGWHRADVVSWPDELLVSAVRAELARLQGVTAMPAFVRVIRWPQAIPQYSVGHPERVSQIMVRAATHPGLFLAGNAYAGVAVNDCTSHSRPLARRVAAYLAGAYDGPHHA